MLRRVANQANDRRPAAPDDVGCGRCGYPTRGLDGPICPECGADRDVVGVRRLGRRRVPPIVNVLGAALAWTLLCVGFAFFPPSQPLLERMPRGLSNHRDSTLTPRPGAMHHRPLTLRRIGYGWGWAAWQGPAIGPQRAKIEVESDRLGPSDVLSLFDVDLRTGQASYGATRLKHGQWASFPSSRWSGPLDEAAIRRWLAVLGADPDHADVRAEAAEILAMLHAPTFADDEALACDGTRMLTVATGGGGVQAVPARHAWPLLAALVAIVWLTGLTVVVRLARPPRRAAHGTELPSDEH